MDSANSKVLTIMPPAFREKLVQDYLALRADGIAIVTRAERVLSELGHPVETAIRTREERRIMGRDEVGEND